MSLHQTPIAGSVYVNLTGKMFKVRAVSYSSSTITNVIVEYADGKRLFIPMENWCKLDLEVVSGGKQNPPTTSNHTGHL